MVWPLYVASAITLMSQMLPQPPKTTTTISAPSSSLFSNNNNSSLFYSGLLSGLSLGYILTTELQRRRIWDYWRLLLWKKRVDTEEESSTVGESGISVQHLVRPQTNRTAQLHVEILTIPPKQRITGTSAGVECYLVLQGRLQVNDDVIVVGTMSTASSSSIVLEPFVSRTLYNPSSTLSATVWRATDGAPKENAIVDDEQASPSTMSITRLSNYFQSSSLLTDYVTASIMPLVSSSTNEKQTQQSTKKRQSTKKKQSTKK